MGSVRIALDCGLARGGIGRGGNRLARSIEAAADIVLRDHSAGCNNIDIIKFDLIHWQNHLDAGGPPVRLSHVPGGVKRWLWNHGHFWKIDGVGTRILGNPHIIHSTDFRIVQGSKSKLLYTLFDLPWVRGEHYADGVRLIVEHALRCADVVVALSESTAEDARQWGVSESKIRVVYPALASVYLESDSVSSASTDPTDGYFLFVGSCGSVNKNFKRVLAAIKQANLGIPLVVVGPDDPTPYIVNHDVTVLYMGNVSETRLLSLYDNATALIFPSLFEGFGYPVAEAMARGCPVLTSNSGSVKEVADFSGVFVDPLDIGDIAFGLSRVADRQVTSDLVEMGRVRAQCFSVRHLAFDL